MHVCVSNASHTIFLTGSFPFFSPYLSTKCIPSFPPGQAIFSLLSQLFPPVNSFLALLLEHTDARDWKVHCGTVGVLYACECVCMHLYKGSSCRPGGVALLWFLATSSELLEEQCQDGAIFLLLLNIRLLEHYIESHSSQGASEALKMSFLFCFLKAFSLFYQENIPCQKCLLGSRGRRRQF